MTSHNIERIKNITEGLGELSQQVVFVGGSVAELYADDPAATEIRMTDDVDCVIEIATYKDHVELERLIRQKGFKNDTDPDAPICRWIYNDEKVDIMPTDKSVLGFSNQWYTPAFPHRTEVALTDNTKIYIFPPLYYVATKIEAIRNRGGNDLRYSHDLEDVIFIINNCRNFTLLFESESNNSLLSYLSEWAQEMLNRPNCREEIECVLPYGDRERSDYIIKILTRMAGDKKK